MPFVDASEELGVTAAHHFATDFCRLDDTIGGPGVCLLDVDGDGRLDVFLPDRAGHPSSLYMNEGDGFRERGEELGAALVDVDAMGCLAFDYDGDGDSDLFVTANGSDRLLRNDGGSFSDVTSEAGLATEEGFSISATAGDVDGDGDLDLFVGRVVDLATCPDQCHLFPIACQAQTNLLWINESGRFVEQSVARGIVEAEPTLATVMLDFDRDGDLDIYVGNDMGAYFPDRLYANDGSGRFTDVAVEHGLEAIGTDTMGVDAGDYDRDGRTDMVITDFEDRPIRLFHCYDPSLPCSNEVVPDGLAHVKWGVGFVDFDHDGWLDLMVATGHVADPSGSPTYLYFQRHGRFVEHAPGVGEALAEPRVSRGVAFGDLDGDGDVDAVLATAGGLAQVLRNEAASGHALTVELDSRAAGAIVTVTTAEGAIAEHALIGGSYGGSSDPRLHFGLGKSCRADVAVHHLDGTVLTRTDVPAGLVTLRR